MKVNNEQGKIEVQIYFGDSGRENLLVTRLDSNLFRIEETSFLGEVNLGDTIEAANRLDGSLEFLAITERSALRHFSWKLPKHVSESQELKILLEKVENHQGSWELVFGGLLHIHLPETTTFDPIFELVRW